MFEGFSTVEPIHHYLTLGLISQNRVSAKMVSLGYGTVWYFEGFGMVPK